MDDQVKTPSGTSSDDLPEEQESDLDEPEDGDETPEENLDD